MRINFCNHEFILHSSGALFWPQERMLIISDLHLEKGSHYAKRGFFLPPYDTHKTLENLLTVCGKTNCQKLLLLGDCFHDPQGYMRMSKDDRFLFDTLLAYDPIWIFGNHDGEFVPEGFEAMHVLEHHGITFRHQAEQETAFEISGHYHPKIEIPFHKGRLSLRCFLEDGHKLILPAFGAYTGGLLSSDHVVQKNFKTPPRQYVLGEDKVYAANF